MPGEGTFEGTFEGTLVAVDHDRGVLGVCCDEFDDSRLTQCPLSESLTRSTARAMYLTARLTAPHPQALPECLVGIVTAFSTVSASCIGGEIELRFDGV